MRKPSVMRMGSRLTCIGVVLAVAVTGCAGPSEPLEVGTQTMSLSLLLGKIKAIQQAPVGPVSSPPAPENLPFYNPPPGPGAPPPSPPSPGGGQPPSDCPMYDPRSPITVPVGRKIPAPPKETTYEYKAIVAEAYPGEKPFVYDSSASGNSIWSVQTVQVDSATGAFDVTYTVKLGKSTTKRVFRVLPQDLATLPVPIDSNPNAIVRKINDLNVLPAKLPANLPNLAGYGLAGIYLVSQESNGVTFRPAVPIALLQLRQLDATSAEAAKEAAITSVGFDPQSQAAMAFKSTVVNNPHDVNACGTRLQAVQVEFTSPYPPGVVPNIGPLNLNVALFARKVPGSDPTRPRADVLLFKEQLDFGLQYGGLVLRDDSQMAPFGVRADGQNPPPPPDGISDEAVMKSFEEWVEKHAIVKVSSFNIVGSPKR